MMMTSMTYHYRELPAVNAAHLRVCQDGARKHKLGARQHQPMHVDCAIVDARWELLRVCLGKRFEVDVRLLEGNDFHS